ncbi:MAG TPA: long-chain fatty acid--CoA ligase [Chitinophagaceae bacterium]|nr:long-chain fatty acid--CoA ligase [Chitinophagaceae bacterium]
MKGLMMQYPLTTNLIIEYGNRVFPDKSIISILPNGTRHEYTYADLFKHCKKLSHALASKLGIQKGDIVGTFAWNHYQHLELYYGIPAIGAVCHTINLRLSPQQIEYIINHAEDKAIFADATLVPLLEKISPLLTTVQHYIIINAPENFSTSLTNVIYYEDLLSGMSEEFEWPMLDETDACNMCYTTGTTGQPKGVLYAHRSTYLHSMAIMMPNAGNMCSSDRVMLIVPQFHVLAWGYPFMCILAGAEMVLPSIHLQPDKLIDIITKENVNKSNGIPTIWMSVYDLLKKNPLENFPLREILVGGSALSKTLLENLERDFGINGVHAWGMTETSPLGTVARLQKKHKQLDAQSQLTKRCQQGIEMPGVEIKAVQEDGSTAPRDGKTFGEFYIRGPWIIDGYYKVLHRENFTEDGWFKTGDVGVIHEDGFMELTDRTKDLVKSGGEWISSVALELALMAHPKVKEASVIAIPDERWMERPLALVVNRNDADPVSKDELKELLSQNFRTYQLPDDYVFINEIPKTSVGKFDKKEMRRMYAEGLLK